jgi:hypothetical protein
MVHCECQTLKNLVISSQDILKTLVSDELEVTSMEEGDQQFPGDVHQWCVVGKDFTQVGSMSFVDHGKENTEIKLQLHLEFSAKNDHPITRSLLALGGQQWFKESIRDFKQLVETGVTATTQGQSHGQRGLLGGQMSSTKDYFKEKIERLMADSEDSDRDLTPSEVRV